MFPNNYVLIANWTFDDNFFSRIGDVGAYYKALTSAELTNDSVWRPHLLTDELQAYLDGYFPGWRLLREVDENVGPVTKRYPNGKHWKQVYHFIVTDTDADAETLASHLRKTGYHSPWELKRDEEKKEFAKIFETREGSR